MISYPKLNRNATNRVTIPLLDGGINLSSGCTHIGDNQLINAKNVWFDGQALKTRPTVKNVLYNQFNISFDDKKVGEYYDYVYFKWKNDNLYSHIVIYYNFKKSENENEFCINAIVNSISGFDVSYKISTDKIKSEQLSTVKVNCYKGNAVTTNGTGIFVLVGLYGADNEKGSLIYEISNTGTGLEFETIYSNIGDFFGAETDKQGTTVDKLYKPLVYQNGKGNKYSELTVTNTTEYAPASVYEGKNLLPSAMRFKFMSDGESTRYNLPATIDITNIVTVKLNIAGFEWSTEDDETVLVFEKGVGQMGGFSDYTITINGEEKVITVSADSTGFEFRDTSGSFVLPLTQTSDNIELIAYNINYDDYEKILDMTIHTEYGGGEGIFGGSRVFLGGYKNFICYSTAKSSTYFSENNYIGVGDSSSVTAFGKMNELLVIFKPNSIYATKTTYSESVTAEQIQNGSVGDIATTYCYFPIYQLTNEVGCDIPNSIRLCLNRLIFANTSNNVYCLVTQSSNSQRNVYCLSEQIKKKLDLNTNAFSASFSDYYLLFCENRVYVLNYNKNSYKYISSNTSNTDNYVRYLTWWYWELEQKNECNYSSAISYNNNVYLALKKNFNSSKKYTEFYYYQLMPLKCDGDCDVLIETKVFDFSAPERYKKIEKLYIGVGNDEYAEIDLTINTDKGEVYHRPLLISNDGKMSSADYGEEIKLTPYLNKVRQFNIKLETKGAFILENLSIYYKQLGEVIN